MYDFANETQVDQSTEAPTAPAGRRDLRANLERAVDAMGVAQSPLMHRLAAAALTDSGLTPRFRSIAIENSDDDILREEGGFVLTMEWVSLDSLTAMSRN